MIENLLDHHRVLDAGDDPDRAFALLAFIDVNAEHPLEPSCRTSLDYSMDDIALQDWPAAIQKVIEVSGKGDVQVIAHCIGSMTLLMSLLAGTKGVRSVISSQVTLHPVTNWLNFLKADINLIKILEQLLAKNKLSQEIPLISVAGYSAAEAKKAGLTPEYLKIAAEIDVICWNIPVPPGETCNNPCCRRIFSVFGPSYLHEQLNYATHIAMLEMFGPAPTRPFEQLTDIFERGYVVNKDGENTYLPNVANLNLPISFIAGELNQLIMPETSARTYEWLCVHNGFENYEREVFSDYGHMDFFIGKTASKDVFPTLLRMLEHPPGYKRPVK